MLWCQVYEKIKCDTMQNSVFKSLFKCFLENRSDTLRRPPSRWSDSRSKIKSDTLWTRLLILPWDTCERNRAMFSSMVLLLQSHWRWFHKRHTQESVQDKGCTIIVMMMVILSRGEGNRITGRPWWMAQIENPPLLACRVREFYSRTCEMQPLLNCDPANSFMG